MSSLAEVCGKTSVRPWLLGRCWDRICHSSYLCCSAAADCSPAKAVGAEIKSSERPESKTASGTRAKCFWNRSETRPQAATEAVREFADRIDESMPDLVDPSLRKKIIDAAQNLVDEPFDAGRVPAQHH